MTAVMSEPTTETPREPIPVVVTRWLCPYCHRGRSRRGPCEEHMARCWRNPALKGCKTCFFYERDSQGEHCNAGFRLKDGLVTKCTKWKPES